MVNSIQTVYTTQDPDYGTLVLGYVQETPLYASILSTALTTPLATSNILLYDPPADLNGDDYIEESVTATAGNIVENDVDETFTFVQTKGISFAGTVQVLVNTTIDLDQVDATKGGCARIETILVELLKYKISDGTTTQLGILTRTIEKDVAGEVVTAVYAEPTFTELFLFDVGISPKITIGQMEGYLLQARVKITFSASAITGATTDTIAKCRLNCYRDLSRNTIVKIPVV